MALWFNQSAKNPKTHDWLRNRDFRQALSLAIDRDELACRATRMATESRLDLDQALSPVSVEGENIESSPIAIFLGDPPYLPSQIRSLLLLKPRSLKAEDCRFASFALLAISKITLTSIEFSDQSFQRVGPRQCWL